jgi:tryptophan synthase beta subunit
LPRLLAGTEGAGGDWPEETVVLIGLSGRGDKDLATLGKAEAAAAAADR